MPVSSQAASVAYLISASIHRALELKRYLNRLAHREYASENPEVLVEAIGAVVDQILTSLMDLAQAEARDPGKGSREGQVRVLSRALEQLAAYTEPAATSIEADLPWGVLFPLEVFCRQVTPDSRVVIYPHWQQGYAYRELSEPLREILRGLPGGDASNALETFPRHLAAVSYPTIQGSDILRNAAWGHEIGHHLDTVYTISEKVLQEPIFRRFESPGDIPQFGAGSVVQEGEGVPDGVSAYLKLLELRFRCVRKWVVEMVADVFAIHAFGPASLLAFADIAPALQPLEEPSKTHPPPCLRISVMLEELRCLGYNAWFATGTERQDGPMMAAVAHRLDVLAQAARGDTGEPVDPFYAPVLEAAVAAVPLIAARVREAARSTWACSAEKIADDVAGLVTRLRQGIPPCEIDIPGSLEARDTSLAAIVNAGWFFLIGEGLDRLPQDEQDAVSLQQRRDELNSLILKAIELSAARRYLGPSRTEP